MDGSRWLDDVGTKKRLPMNRIPSFEGGYFSDHAVMTQTE